MSFSLSTTCKSCLEMMHRIELTLFLSGRWPLKSSLKGNILSLGHENKKPCFTDVQTFQIGSVGRDIFFLNNFFLSDGKNDSLENNKISQKSGIFWKKIWKKVFSYFQKFYTKFSLTLTKNGCFYIFDSKLLKKEKEKKNLPKWKIFIGCTCKTRFFFCGLKGQYLNFFLSE